MAVFALFSLATLFLFVNIEPFRVVGVLLSLCYIPGLVLFASGRWDRLYFEDLFLAFPASVGISSILTLALLFAGVHVANVSVIIHLITGAAVILYALKCYRQKAYAAIELTGQQLIFILIALTAALLLSIPFFSGPNRISISAHAFHHSLLITQIMNGIFPPENPGLGGTIIGYYWGFHALIAALTVKTNFQQIQLMFMLNAISLYFIFCVSYSFAKAFGLSEKYCRLMPFALIGIMRIDAGLFYLLKLFSGDLVSLKALTAFPLEPNEVLSYWTEGLPWTDSRLFFLHKLYNVSGMLLAVCLCYSYLFILLKRGPYGGKTFTAGAVLIFSASFLNYPPLAFFLLFFAPLWACYIFLSTGSKLREKTGEALRVMVPYFIAGLIVSPYMLYIIAARDISSGGQGGILSFDFYNQSVKNLIVFIVPLPVIVYGVRTAMKRFSLSQEFFFPAIGTVLCLALVVFTRWPFNNSYKFNYVLILFWSLFFVLALDGLSASITGKWFKRLSATVIVLILSLTPIMVESSHIVSSFSTDYVYSFKGRHIIFAQDRQRNEAYTWIQENTPYNALIMLPYTETNWPCCGLQNNYEPAVIAERTLYVIKDTDYTVSNPEYAKRVSFRKRLFEDPEDPSVNEFFSGLNRPVYLLLEDRLDESRFFVEDRFRPYPYEPDKGFRLVYQNDRQRVYLLRPGTE